MRNAGLTLFTLSLSLGCGGVEPPPIEGPTEMRVIVEGQDRQAVLATGAASSGWIHGSAEQTRIFVGADGQTYVGIWIEAPDTVVEGVERAPMALSLVIDTSGSMEGQKIQHARMAAISMLDTLADGDVVSVLAFSNRVTEIAPPTSVSQHTRALLTQQIHGLRARGGTNMYDGIRFGQSRLSESPATHPVRRLVVVSDGRANIGPRDPAVLGQLAAQGTEWGAQVTAIGVGLDYDESTLAALAVNSSGRLYHLSHPAQMAVILRDELNLLSRTVATNAWIEVVPEQGVQILGVDSLGANLENGRIRVPVGNLHAGQRREVLFRARVDTSAIGNRGLASARFGYAAPEGGDEQVQTLPLRYEVTDDRASADGSGQADVVAMVANHRASQAQLRAVELLNQGRNHEAAAQYEFAEDQIDGALQAAPAGSAGAARLQDRASRLRRGRVRAVEAEAPAAARDAALEANDEAYGEMGF